MSALPQPTNVLPFVAPHSGVPVAIPEAALSVLTVDLSAIAENWRILSDMVGPHCTVAAVVKADAYGLGVVPVIRKLAETGCRCFFVGTLDEGLEASSALRDFPGCSIALLHGLPGGSAEPLLAHDLIPVLNHAPEVRSWLRAAPARPQILQLDSGMSRLGLNDGDLDWLSDLPLDPMLVLSHLGCADEPDNPMNRVQRDAFERLAGHWPNSSWSLAASSGVFLGPPYHYRMVRVGAALWGLNPAPGKPNPMRPVLGIKARILQIHDIGPGQSVGYGATYKADKPTRIATIGIGYADGIPRTAGNRARAFIGSVETPYIGRISMDLTAIDVSAVPEAALKIGGMADIVGPHYGADALAADSGTIGYEFLTRLSRRLHRIYLP